MASLLLYFSLFVAVLVDNFQRTITAVEVKPHKKHSGMQFKSVFDEVCSRIDNRTVGHLLSLSVCHSVSQSVGRSFTQSVRQSVSQSVSHSLTHSVSHSLTQSVTQSVSNSNSNSISL